MKTRALMIATAALAGLLQTPAGASPDAGFASGRTDFAVRVAGEVISHRVLALPVLPGAALVFEIVNRDPEERFTVLTAAGGAQPLPAAGWSWIAPTITGLHPVRIRHDGTGEEMVLNVFVMVPYDRIQNERLNGYRIGSYPSTALRGLAIYTPPPGFIEVTRANLKTPISPHLRLEQFVCKQAGGYPKYIVLRPRLLRKLEILLERLNAAGYRADGFHVLSGYRTPYYNAAIGNVRYSRHVWGGAADVFVDQAPRDGLMDDLNKDGKIDYRDAAVIYELVDGMYGKKEYEPFVGGLGRYKKTAAHGPFVHVDVRGFRARWGT